MAPDRGDGVNDEVNGLDHEASEDITDRPVGQEPSSAFLAKRSEQPQFTIRALLLGLLIGVLIAFSNTYFGLQTGWISGMAMPSALVGFAYFRGLRSAMGRLGDGFKRYGLGEGFSEVENVLVQTVAGSVGTMPLGCGFVGVIPALEFLLKPSETPESNSTDPDIISALALGEDRGGVRLPLGKLIIWALGLCFFGVVLAVPLRKQVIVREKLRFPSGTATALMIGVLHGGEKTGEEGNIEQQWARERRAAGGDGDEESRALIANASPPSSEHDVYARDDDHHREDSADKKDWLAQIRLLLYAFLVSGIYTLVSYFVPQLHSIPILGSYLSSVWLWNLNPSPAYVGQGIIMGPATTIHMFLGAVLGWAVLSPLAKFQGWASGDVSDWERGSKGWIVWISLAIMLADSIVSLGWLVLRPLIGYTWVYAPFVADKVRRKGLRRAVTDLFRPSRHAYSRVGEDNLTLAKSKSSPFEDDEENYDAPPEHQIGVTRTLIGLVLTLGFCIFAVQYSFAGIIPIKLTILSLILAMFLSVMAVRALGETDLNPVSGISKLTQLIFALVTPKGSKNAVVINLLAGGISEAGALQAGDLLQDLKCGHLLGASPKAQFYGQLIGSGVGAVVSAAVYKLYTKVYTIPGGLFQVPTGFVWVFTARLVTGEGLPDRVGAFAVAAFAIWSVLTALRIYGQSKRNADGSKGAPWVAYVPGGIAVAVGMYNTPSFTLARTVGGLIAWVWTRWYKREETRVIVLASGLILGEGIVSIVNLGLASAHAPHL
ncbi:oligopeptide transporter [Neohortaea acidophila]|uniref:Oligopeptide transporter n=1 Tax=Neohortaea acidophila TaxID=245834 RepID=A0A6A6PJH2_9PEZI|nr:oligopeptide transporter [Neohortaea acidophila]KAF2480149.1 oligopeptide transporter [Neohortaea acidophila]